MCECQNKYAASVSAPVKDEKDNDNSTIISIAIIAGLAGLIFLGAKKKKSVF